jgi:hypothetical protein
MRSSGKGRVFGAGTVLVCSLAACSHGSDSAQTQSSVAPVNPCSALAPSDIQTALGKAPASQGSRDNMTVVDKCTWTMPSGGDVDLSFYNPVGAATMYTPQVSSRTSRDKTYETVAGLGDQAVYRDDSSPAIAVSETVEAVKGQRHFDVQYVDAEGKAGAPSKDAMVALARAVLTHVR